MINVSDKTTGEVYAQFNTVAEVKDWINKNCDFSRVDDDIFMCKGYYYGNEIEIWMGC